MPRPEGASIPLPLRRGSLTAINIAVRHRKHFLIFFKNLEIEEMECPLFLFRSSNNKITVTETVCARQLPVYVAIRFWRRSSACLIKDRQEPRAVILIGQENISNDDIHYQSQYSCVRSRNIGM